MPSSPLAPPQDQVLANLRNALEHLDEADFDDEAHVTAGPHRGNRSLRALPGAELSLGPGSELLFELIDPADLEQRALAVIEAAEATC